MNQNIRQCCVCGCLQLSKPQWVTLGKTRLDQSTSCDSSLHQPLSLFECHSSYTRPLLWLMHVYEILHYSRHRPDDRPDDPPPSSSHPEVLYWCDRTRLDRPGHGGTDGRSEGAIKVSFFTVFINSWWCWGEPLPIMGSLQPLTSVNRAGQLSASAWAGPMRALH